MKLDKPIAQYSKSTYLKPYVSKFIRVLGTDIVGTTSKPKMEVLYGILANNGIKPVDKDNRGNFLFSFKDLDGLVKSDISIINGYHKYKEDMIRKDVERDIRDRDKKIKKVPGYSVHNRNMDNSKETPEMLRRKEMEKASDELLRQQEVYFDDPEDDRLYESLFGKKVYFTEEQMKYIKESIIKESHLIGDIVTSFSDKDDYIKNEFGEKWKRIPVEDKLFKKVHDMVDFDNKSRLSLAYLAKVEDEGDRYIGVIFGGLNGSGEWSNYLKDIRTAFSKINSAYLINLDNDCLDDTWTLLFAFHGDKVGLNEGADGYQPEDSDAYWDMCYDISKGIFEDLINRIKKNLKVKNDNMVYTYLGIVNHYIQIDELQTSLHYDNKDIEEENMDCLAVRLIKACSDGFKYLNTDTGDNRQGWEDFDEYKRNLYIQGNLFKDSMKLLNYDIDIHIPKRYHLHESTNYVDPQKVLLISKYLDDNFVRASIPTLGNDGYPTTLSIVGMKGTDGQVIKNMTSKQLFYLLQDKFQGIYGDKNKRDSFIKQVMIDWYNKKISPEGLLSKNTY